MPLTLAEFHIRKRLPKRSLILLFDAACLLGWTSVKAIAELAGVKYDHARVQLANLVREGWLLSEWQGPRNQLGRVRFTPRVEAVGGGGGRSPAIGQGDLQRSARPITRDRPPIKDARASDPDLSLDHDPETHASVRPEGVQGERATADGRTEVQGIPEVRGADVQWLVELWGDGISGAIARQMLTRLFALGLSRRDARDFLADAKRGAHVAFAALDKAQFPLGAACSAERVERWCLARARARAREREPSEPQPRAVGVVSAREIEDFVRSQLRRR